MTSAYQNAIGAEVPVKLTPAGAVPTTLSGEAVTVAFGLDSTGAAINPDAWAHTYTHSTDARLLTDTGTDGIATWVKTYSYNSAGLLSDETKWVRQ